VRSEELLAAASGVVPSVNNASLSRSGTFDKGV